MNMHMHQFDVQAAVARGLAITEPARWPAAREMFCVAFADHVVRAAANGDERAAAVKAALLEQARTCETREAFLSLCTAAHAAVCETRPEKAAHVVEA